MNRVELSSLSGPGRCSSKSSDISGGDGVFQVHIRITSHFPNNQVVLPNEEFLRAIFEPLGDMVDISVKEYVMQTVSVHMSLELYSSSLFIYLFCSLLTS